MTKSIAQCGRCGKENANAMSGWVPFSGELKTYVEEQICDACWSQWLSTQLMAINEYRLNLGRPEHQQVLRDLASEYLRFGAPAESAQGGASLEHLDGVWSPPEGDDD